MKVTDILDIETTMNEFIFKMKDGRIFIKPNPLTEIKWRGYCSPACKFHRFNSPHCTYKSCCNYLIPEETILLLEL
jgi:hypothetical protein